MASKECASDIKVPNTLGQQLGLNIAWITDQQFGCYAYGGKEKRESATTKTLSSVDVNMVGADFIFEEPTIRAMVTEGSRVFYRLQRLRYDVTENPAKPIDYVKISQKYRSIVRRGLQAMNQQVSELSDDDASLEAYRNLISLFYSIECTWHLLEFLVIDSNSSGAIVSSLLEWIRFHFPEPERAATEMLQSGRELDKQEEYWPVVKGLILQGQTTIARALLRVHTSSETHCFQVAEQLLQSIPIYSVYSGLSVHRYKTQWQCWCDNVRTLVAAGNFAAEPKLEELLRLVSGERKAWSEQLRSSTCWYEYFPGYLLYTDSSCKYYQLGQYANDWIAQFLTNWRAAPANASSERQFKFLDKLVLSVMENNLVSVLQQVQLFPDNRWFAVHIVDLLYHAGLLEMNAADEDENTSPSKQQSPRGVGDVSDGKMVRESLLFDYGSLLMSHSTFWQIGMDYLEFSSTEGLGAREALLARVPFQTERQADRIIAVARQNGYPEVVAEVCKVMTKRSLAHKNYSSALDWATRSRDSSYVRDVANIFLEHYCNHGELLCEQQVSHLGSKVFISSRLVFLGAYYDFRRFYRERSYDKAADLLVRLMDSKIMPSYFWPCLMADAVPLLEFSEPIIPSKETYTILEHLEMDLVPMLEQRRKKKRSSSEQDIDMNMEQDVTDREAAKDHDQTALLPKFYSNLLNNCTEDLVKILRLACARNLSRALIIENTDPANNK
ncbi:nuclear pore complex protein Nup75 [Anopheles stephensi]|uniref:nuclear pore complex protein Nup75 n=1 Tax=Anopheles stephensi TaxID=30069 RepID=UPI00165896C8|nr:nuclear pore complex protein Nup75 [Anopheles stephensi]